MAIHHLTTFLLRFFSQPTPPGDYDGGPTAEVGIDDAWPNGVATGQADKVWQDDSRSLAASASENIDLQTETDVYGTALGLVDVRMLIISTPTTNLGTIRMVVDLTDAAEWTAWIKSGGATDDAHMDFPPGTTVVLFNRVDNAFPVAAGDKTLEFLNLDGVNANVYSLTIVGASS